MAAQVLSGRHAFVSFRDRTQLDIVIEVCQSFALDNGAFSIWRHNGEDKEDWQDYYDWVYCMKNTPNMDFAIIPDVITGTEQQNDALLAEWPHGNSVGVPVWHLHESMDRLKRLCNNWPRVALGSSGKYHMPGSIVWWHRIGEAMDAICDDNGKPSTKLHGLRMLNPALFTRLPLASADSTNVGRNLGMDCEWKGTYTPPNKAWRGIILAERIESNVAASRWQRHGVQEEITGLFPKEQEQPA